MKQAEGAEHLSVALASHISQAQSYPADSSPEVQVAACEGCTNLPVLPPMALSLKTASEWDRREPTEESEDQGWTGGGASGYG